MNNYESQNQRILKALSGGPKTSWDLAQIALQYNRCIFDIRSGDIRVRAVEKRDGRKKWSVFHLLTPQKKIDFKKCIRK